MIILAFTFLVPVHLRQLVHREFDNKSNKADNF